MSAYGNRQNRMKWCGLLIKLIHKYTYEHPAKVFALGCLLLYIVIVIVILIFIFRSVLFSSVLFAVIFGCIAFLRCQRLRCWVLMKMQRKWSTHTQMKNKKYKIKMLRNI